MAVHRVFIAGMILSALAAVAAAPARADSTESQFRAGLSAFNGGDYAVALRVWGKLAEHDEPRAQAGLGFMYHHGMGVEVDDRKASVWLTKAAEHGSPEGQLMLGSLYFYGQGVKQSYVHAFAWCDVAQQSGEADAFQCREAASQAIASEADQREAFKLSAELSKRISRNH